MQKQPIIQLHILCAEIRVWLAEHGGEPDDAYVEYDNYHVRPTHVHRTKTDHHQAIKYLLTGINRTIQYQAAHDQQAPSPTA